MAVVRGKALLRSAGFYYDIGIGDFFTEFAPKLLSGPLELGGRHFFWVLHDKEAEQHRC